MNEVMYKTTTFLNDIKRVDVVKKTKYSVWIDNGNGRIDQHRISSDSYQFHSSFQDAKEVLIQIKKASIKYFEERIGAEKKDLAKIEQLENIYGGEND